MSYVGEITNGVLKKYIGPPPAKLKVTTKVTEIGTSAFSDKQSLTEVTFHDAITEIGNNAFGYCRNLKKVNFSKGLKIIGKDAFINCMQLSDLEFPDSLEEIGSFAFYNTAWLNAQKGNVYSHGFLLQAEQNGDTYKIIPGTKEIVGGAFADCTSVARILIPDSVRIIGENAFSGGDYLHLKGCESLTEIAIPDSVEQIGKNAFTGCYSLRKITISADTVKRLGNKTIENAFFFIPETNVWEKKEAYLKCLPIRFLYGEIIEFGAMQESLNTCLRKKNIRKQLINYFIYNNEHEALSRLLNIQKKLTLEEIEEYYTEAEKRKESALCKAVLLEYKNKYYSQADVCDAEQVKSEKDLGIKELSVADWRKIFKFSSKNGKTIISGYVGDSTDVLIPEKIGANAVTEIREGAFKKDSKIQTMVIEAGIKTIPKEAFVWSSMTSIELPPALTKIDTNAFCHSTQLRKIVLPPKTKEIGYSAFAHCDRLKSAEFSKGLRIIQNGAFSECKELESVTFAKGLKVIGKNVFDHCTGLKTLRFPDSLEEIGTGACGYCKSLSEVYIGANTVKIGDYAFVKCENLIIHAPAGSYAEQYAKEHNIPFVAE